jgi:hypothetical protein
MIKQLAEGWLPLIELELTYTYFFMENSPSQRSGNRQRAEWRTRTRDILAEHLRESAS